MADNTITLIIRAEAGQLVGEAKLSQRALADIGKSGETAGKAAAQGLGVATRGTQSLSAASVAAASAVKRSHRDIAGGIESISVQLARAQKLYAAWIVGSQAIQSAAGIARMADAYTNLTSKIRNVVSSEADLASVRQQAFDIAQRTRAGFESTVELYTRLTRATADLGVSQADNLRITETINKAFVVSGASAGEASAAIIQLAQGLSAGALRGDEFNSVAEQAPILMDLLGKSLGMTRGELRAYAAEGKITAEVVTTALLEGGASVDAQFANMSLTIAGAATQMKNAAIAFVGDASDVSGAASLVAGAIGLVAQHFGALVSAGGALAALWTGRIAAAFAARLAQTVVVASETAALAAAELTEARAAEAAALAQVNRTRALVSAGLATASATEAETAYAAAQARTAAATAAATAAGAGRVGMLARAGSGLLALVGGPIGAAVLAVSALATGIYTLYQREQERIAKFDAGIRTTEAATASVRELADQVERAAGRIAALPALQDSYAAWQRGAEQLAAKQQELAGAQARVAELAPLVERGIGSLAGRLERAKVEAGALEDAVRGLAGELERLDLGRLFNPSAAQVAGDQAGQAFALLTAGAKEAEAQIEKNKQGQIEYWQALANTRIEQERAAGASAEQIAAMRAENAALLETIGSTLKKTDAGADLVERLQHEVATYGLSGTALARYEISLKKLTPEQRKQAQALIDTIDEYERLARALRPAYEAIDRILGGTRDLDEQLAQGADILAGLDDAQVQYNASLREANELYEDALALGPPTAAMQEAEAERLAKLAALRDQRIAIRDQQEATRAWQEATRAWQEAERAQLQRSQQAWGDWADAVFNAVTRSGNFLKNLLANLRQVVTQMIAEWFRTRVIGLFASGGGMGGLAMGAAGQAMSAGAGGFNFLSPTSWIDAGKNLWNGFAGAGARTGGNLLGSWTSAPAFAGDMGPGWANPAQFSMSTIGQYIGWGAGLAGMYYGATQRGNGGLSSAAAGLSYGALGLGGVGFLGGMGAGIGGGVAGATGAFASLGAASWIPVVGWIAAIAGLVDMISGGKLFGTKWSALDLKQDIGVGPDGATAGLTMGQVRQGALFSGREWRDVAQDVPPELLEAAERFYAQIQKVMTDGARRLAIDTPPMITAQIRTLQEFDKKGNVTATKYFVDALGRQWEEASAELAATRVTAEAIIATVAASDAGHAASQIAEQWRYSAEVLLDGAQLMLAATVDIQRGRGLLSHGTGLDPDGGVTLPGAPTSPGGGGPHDGAGGPFAQRPKDAAAEANDELARTVALVQELAHADEALADAYARLQADTELLQRALDLAGVSLDRTAEDFVRLAAGIEDAAGGLQQAQALWEGFFSAFYDDAERSAQSIALMREDVTAQLAGLGLDATTSMEAFRAEFESKLPTLSADEIVQWLQAANALASLSDAQAQLEQQVLSILGPMGLAGQGLSLFGQALVGIKAQEQAAIDAANALARSRGAEGASAVQLAAIHQWTTRQIAAAIRQLQAETRRLVADLYGDVPGSLDLINQRIGELEGAAGGIADSVGRIADAGAALFERWAAGVQSVQEYLDSMLLGDLSALTPEEQIAEAQRQLLAAQQAAMGGDADALARLPQMADAYLRLVRGSLASGGDYNAEFDWVRQLLEGVTELPDPGTAAPGEGATVPGSVELVPSQELQDLYAARDAALAEQEAEYRRQLAQQLAEHLADLAEALGVPILALIEAQGVNLRALATDLGVDLANLNAASIDAIGGMATTLGVPLAELVAGLGLTLPDLHDGLLELTGQLGIDLTNLTGETASQLAALAGSLGGNLKDLSTALGIDLGKLTDVNSPIFVALRDNIGAMAPDIRGELEPLLDAIATATSDEQANAAVKALRDHVDALAPDIRNQLGPFFDDIFPESALDQLDYLDEIRRIAGDQLSALTRIAGNLKAANDDAGIPSYAVGTPWVQGDQVAQIHHGEAVVPAAVNQWLRGSGWAVGGAANDDRLVAELQRIGERLDRLDRNNIAGHAGTQGVAERVGRDARTQRDDIARRSELNLRRGT